MCVVTSSSCISNSCSDLFFFHLQYVSFFTELDGEVDVITCRTTFGSIFFTQPDTTVKKTYPVILHWNLDLELQFVIVKTPFGWDCSAINLFEVDTWVERLIAALVHCSILNLMCYGVWVYCGWGGSLSFLWWGGQCCCLGTWGFAVRTHRRGSFWYISKTSTYITKLILKF